MRKMKWRIEAVAEEGIDIYDNTVPILSILTPTAGYSIPEYGDVTVTWAASDNIGLSQIGFHYSPDGSNFDLLGYISSDSTSFTFNVGASATSYAVIRVFATDESDNVSYNFYTDFLFYQHNY